ncbi:30S ribosomal protein S12 methylthiotransferase RimO [Thermodesulfitimonas sp.]
MRFTYLIYVGAISLGCAKNLVDTEVMLGLLGAAGYAITADPGSADVLLINTCAFITPAQRESIAAILEAARYKEEGRLKALVVAGCLAQRHGQALLREMPEIDALIGTGKVGEVVTAVTGALAGKKPVLLGLPGFLSGTAPRLLTTPAYMAYIKIAEGCSNRCSFCVIPQLRGPYRSRCREEILAEARSLAAQGVKEVTLVAQDTTKWGLDLYGRPELPSLLREVARLEGIRWVRLLYAYPTGISDELLGVLAAEEKVCNYLDIPLQHVSPQLLRAMKRPVIDVPRLVERVRAAVLGVTLRTTFIVGFPGETAADFALLAATVRECGFDRVGIFPYFREEGTAAAALPGQVPWRVKRERLRQLWSLACEVSLQRNQEKVGRELLVLVEGSKGRRFYGRSEADAPEVDGKVYFTARETLPPGTFVRVRVTGARPYDLVGEMIGIPEIP